MALFLNWVNKAVQDQNNINSLINSYFYHKHCHFLNEKYLPDRGLTACLFTLLPDE